MAIKYQYLVDPLLGFQTKNGSLNTAGIINVYDAATDDPAVTYKDFVGTRNAQDIRLDDNGRAVIICDDSRAYRVEVRDQYGALLYTQSPMYAKGGGGGTMGGIDIISSDETVKIEATSEGGVKTFDLSVDKDDPEYAVCDSYYVMGSGSTGSGYIVPQNMSEGNMTVDSRGILLIGGHHYHIDAWLTVTADPDSANPSNEYRQREMTLNFRFTADSTPVDMVFDNSFAHSDSFTLSGDLHPTSDTYLKIYFDNYEWADYSSGSIPSSHISMPRIDVHSIVGSYNGTGGGGGGTDYQAGEGINITGDVISIDDSVVQHKLVAGDNISINPVTNVISVTGLTQEQSDWDEDDPTDPSYIRNRPDLSQYVTESELALDLSDYQKKLVAGTNISIDPVTNVISASGAAAQIQSDWAQTNDQSVDFIKNKPQNLVQDANYVHTDNNFTDADKNKLDGIESGAEVNVQANWNETNSSSDAYILNKPDLSDYVTDTELTTILQGYQEALTAGNGISISSGTISAKVDGSTITFNGNGELVATGSSFTQQQSDWAQTNTQAVDFIKNKPSTKPVVAGSNITITEGANDITIAATVTQQVQSNWNESDTSAPSYILNKPDLSGYVTDTELQTELSGYQETLTAGSNITIANNVISATAAPQQQSDWDQTDNTAVDYIKNKPSIPTVPTMKELVAGAGITLTETSNNVTVASTITQVTIGTVTV